MIDNIFLQISVLLGITVSIAFVVRLLRQPLMIAYIIAGIVAGPLFLNIIHGGNESFEAFAEFGVVLLLFVVGLSLNFSYIKKVGKVAVIAGIGQVLFTTFFGLFILRSLGYAAIPALYLAVGITFSSTIIIIKLLSEKKDMESVYGRYTIGLLLVQDVIAIVIMIFLTTLEEEGMTLFESFGMLALKGLALVSLIYFLAKVVLPFILHRVAKSGEFLFLFTVAWCLGVASLVRWFGFSLEIGAVLAGISLGSTPYSAEIGSRIKPLRDFFIVLFFIILGSEMSLANISLTITPSIILSIFILVGNPFILYILFRMMKFTRRNSFLVGLTAAQVSEFGFILLFVGQQTGFVGTNELTILTMVALITISVSSYLITYNEQIYRFISPALRFFGKDQYQQPEDKKDKYEVWVIGYHRIGWKVCETLMEKKVKFAVIDYNPEVISKLKHRGIPAYFGDVADVEFLEELSFEKSKMIVSTILEPDDQKTFIQYIRSVNKKAVIIANLHHNLHIQELYAAGANYVLMPHLLSGNWLSTVLTEKPWTKRTFADLKRVQKGDMKLKFPTPLS